MTFLFGFVAHTQAQSNQIVVNGSLTTPAVFSSGSCGYTWTNSAPGIGLPARGAGNIASFKAINTGTTPITATITATPIPADLAYIANSGSNNISVVSTGTKTVVATIPVGRNPFGAAVSRDGRTVFITNKDDGTVSVIDVYSNTVTATITVGAGPQGIAFSPDSKYLYVACGAVNTVSIIDLSANTVVNNIAVGQNPYGVAFNPSGTLAYITNYNGRSVSVINTASLSVVATIGTGDNPAGIVISRDGVSAYVATAGANKLTVINTATNTITKEITVSNNPVAIALSADGTQLYLTGLSGFMSIVNPVTNFVIGTAAPGGFGIAFTWDYSAFYYTDKLNNRLSYTAANLASGGIISPLGNGPTSFGNFIAPGPPCNLPTITFTVEVDPSPIIQLSAVTGSISACEGTVSSSPNIEQFAVSGVSLNADININAPANFEISLNTNSGYTNSISLPAVSGTVNNAIIFIRSTAGAPSGSLTGNIICTSTGAADKQAAVNATINPIPIVNTVANQTISAGATINAINFTGTATLYSWVNNTSGIGLAASGSGNINSFTAVNTTHNPIIATITITPSTATCTGTSTTFSITVNPAPVITANANLMPISAEYGNMLPVESITISGANLSTGITVTAPSGFEVSNDKINFTSNVIIGAAGDVATTTIYFRLKSGSAVNTYFGNIVLSSPGAANVNIPIPNITITPAPLTIAADNITKTYGEVLQNSTSSTSFKIIAGALKNGDSLPAVGINYGAGATANAAVGSYPTVLPVVTNGGKGFLPSNYNITPVSGNITVVPATLTITANDKKKIYNAENPPLTIHYNGFVNSEGLEVLTVKPTISTIATRISSVGNYPIIATGALATNYIITYIDGTLTITPAPPTIMPPNAFTPNGDGINDLWEIPALAAYPNCIIKIYSRWGKLVFQSIGYSKPWDGRYNNALLAVGTYYYIIEPGDLQKPVSGALAIIR